MKRIALALAMAAALAAAAPSSAEARPGWHRHHHARHHVHHRKHARQAKPAPTAEEPSFWQRLTAAGSDRVSMARRYLGETAAQIGLPRSLWCADFTNLILRRLGEPTTGSRAAASFASYGRNAGGPVVGAIAVMHRRGGGHVGIVTGVKGGTVTVISGNHLGAVREAAYPRSRIYAYRM